MRSNTRFERSYKEITPWFLGLAQITEYIFLWLGMAADRLSKPLARPPGIKQAFGLTHLHQQRTGYTLARSHGDRGRGITLQ